MFEPVISPSTNKAFVVFLYVNPASPPKFVPPSLNWTWVSEPAAFVDPPPPPAANEADVNTPKPPLNIKCLACKYPLAVIFPLAVMFESVEMNPLALTGVSNLLGIAWEAPNVNLLLAPTVILGSFWRIILPTGNDKLPAFEIIVLSAVIVPLAVISPLAVTSPINRWPFTLVPLAFPYVTFLISLSPAIDNISVVLL